MAGQGVKSHQGSHYVERSVPKLLSAKLFSRPARPVSLLLLALRQCRIQVLVVLLWIIPHKTTDWNPSRNFSSLCLLLLCINPSLRRTRSEVDLQDLALFDPQLIRVKGRHCLLYIDPLMASFDALEDRSWQPPGPRRIRRILGIDPSQLRLIEGPDTNELPGIGTELLGVLRRHFSANSSN